MNFSDCRFKRCFEKNLAGVFLSLLVASRAAALPAPMLEGAAPVIDGDLSDACWQNCAPLTNLFYAPGAEQPMEVQTSVKICRDDAWLYLALRCDEPVFNRILASDIPRDGATGSDDNIEVYIDPGTGGKAAGQFVLAAGGGKRDVWFDGRKRDLEWNVAWRGVAKLDPHIDSATGWSAELAIPLAALGERGDSQEWRINICRTRRASSPPEYSALARVPRDGGFYYPSKFLTLEGMNAQNILPVFSPLLGEITLSPLAWNGAAFVFTVNAALTNSADAAGAALLVFRDESGSSLEEKVELRGREGKTVSRLITAGNASARAVTVCLQDAGLPAEWLDIRRVHGAGVLDSVFPDRNYYTTEQTALVYVELGMAHADIEHSGLLAQVALYNANALQNGILDKKARVLAASDWTSCVSRLTAVSLPLNELASGKYIARLTIARPGDAKSKSWWPP